MKHLQTFDVFQVYTSVDKVKDNKKGACKGSLVKMEMTFFDND